MKPPSKLWTAHRPWATLRIALTIAAFTAWGVAAFLARDQDPRPRWLVLRDRSASAPAEIDLRLPSGVQALDFAATPSRDVRERSALPDWTWHSDLERALRAGLESLDSVGRRLWLLSDGRATRGDLTDVLRAAREAGVPVDVTPLTPSVPFDVRIESLEAPALAAPGEPFSIRCGVAWEGELPEPPRVRLLERRGDAWQSVDERVVPQEGSGAEIVFTRHAPDQGDLELEVRVIAPQTSAPWDRNDRRATNVSVDRRQRVLWLHSGRPSAASAPADTDGFRFLARRWPVSPEDLNTADVIVIVDLSADQLESSPTPWAQLIAERGKGLLALGSSHSLGPGGWVGRPIEAWLPVWCTPTDEAGADLWILVDHSGSMAGEPLARARRAVRSVLTGASPRDTAALSGFAASLETPVTVKVIDGRLDRHRVDSVLSAWVARGGTRLVSALEALLAQLPEPSERRAHVLVLSDGQVSDENPAERLVELGKRFGEKRVALSVHAARSDADRQLLEGLVSAGFGGRYYEAGEIEALPGLFLADVRKEWIHTGPVRVDAREEGRRLPDLERLVRTADKPGAEVLALTEDAEPVLARWRRGAGQAGVFTSGGERGWASAWQTAERWEEVLRAIAPPRRGAWTLSVRPDRRPGWLEVVASSRDAIPRESLALRAGVGTDITPLEPLGSATWVGERFGAGTESDAWELVGPAGEVLHRVASAGPWTQELAHWKPDHERLARIAQATGGRFRDLDEPVSSPDSPSVAGRLLPVALIGIGILLLIASRGVRR